VLSFCRTKFHVRIPRGKINIASGLGKNRMKQVFWNIYIYIYIYMCGHCTWVCTICPVGGRKWQGKLGRPNKDDSNRLSTDTYPFAVITLCWIQGERKKVQIRGGGGGRLCCHGERSRVDCSSCSHDDFYFLYRLYYSTPPIRLRAVVSLKLSNGYVSMAW
jgi:hypothetical protein